MERVWRSLKLGLKSLLLHKLRSGLTVLGIVFGVAAVIAMLAVAEGTSRDQQEQLQALGAVNIIIDSQKPTEETQAAGGRPARILNFGLKYEDYDRLMATVPTVKKALAYREIRKEIRYLNRTFDGAVIGTTPLYADFNRLQMEKGRFLSEADNEHYENYAVLGHDVAEKLFPFEEPRGKSVKLGSDYYTIIGVVRAKATAAAAESIKAQEYNKYVFIPLNTCRLRFGERIIDNRSGQFSAEETQLTRIILQVGDIKQVRPTAPLIEAAVKPWHPKKDVLINVPLDLIERAEAQARQWAWVLGTIAAISLIVGGIGIMNIMLATVTERTREIGIRRALGAKRRDITEQFLIEAIVLSGVGGLLGVCLGIVVPHVLAYFAGNIKSFVTPVSVFVSYGISVAVGILFGIYPAQRAAAMDPIDALRHE